MYIYHALINALSAHIIMIIHINLNTLFYSYSIEDSPTTVYQNNFTQGRYGNTHAHTQRLQQKLGTDTSFN